MTIRIQVKNFSKEFNNDHVTPWLEAVTSQVNGEVAQNWGNDSIAYSFINKGDEFLDGAWRFIVADTAGDVGYQVPGAAGDHEMSCGAPVGFALVGKRIKLEPSVTISHEVLEMIGDAFLSRCNQWSDIPNPVFLAQELCDPVADDSLAYEKNRVKLSAFVLPAYFTPGSLGPWSYGKDGEDILQGPNTLAQGGYQLTWDPTNGWCQQSWWQQTSGMYAAGRAGTRNPLFAACPPDGEGTDWALHDADYTAASTAASTVFTPIRVGDRGSSWFDPERPRQPLKHRLDDSTKAGEGAALPPAYPAEHRSIF